MVVIFESGNRYKVEHWGSYFYIITNMCGACPNSKLVKTPIEAPAKSAWQEVLPYKKDTKVRIRQSLASHFLRKSTQSLC